MDYFGKYVTDAQVWRLFPGAGQTGIQKAILTTFKNPLDDLYVNYTIRSSGVSGLRAETVT